MRKTVPEVLHKDWGQRPRFVHTVDRGHNFSQYGLPGWQITFFFKFIFTETFVGFNLLNFSWICYYLLAGKIMVKFCPLTKPLETNQITRFFLSCPLAHPKQKKMFLLCSRSYYNITFELQNKIQFIQVQWHLKYRDVINLSISVFL